MGAATGVSMTGLEGQIRAMRAARTAAAPVRNGFGFLVDASSVA